MDTKTTQQKEFDTALAGLTPEQKAVYTKANPTVGVGGVQQTATSSGSYIPTTISLSDLNGNVRPYNLPKQQTQPAPQGLQSVTGSVVSGIKTDANQTIPPPTQPLVKEDTGITKYMKENFPTVAKAFSTQAQDILTLQQDPELLKKKERATAVSNEIDVLDKQFRDEVAQIKTNPEGKYGGAIQNEIAQAQDRYENRRANIALTYKVYAGDYNAAQEIVNQKVQALKDTNSMQLEQFKLGADAIRNDLSESEKITLSETIKEKERKANDLSTAYENTLKALQSSGQNVPSYIYDAVDAAMRKPNATAADLYKAAGNYANSKTATTVKAPEVQKINGVDMQWNPTTAKWETISSGQTEGLSMQKERSKANVEQITELANNLVSSAVGTGALSRSQPGFFRNVGKGLTIFGLPQTLIGAYQRVTGEQQNFIAGVEQLRSGLNLETLIQAKAQGATFGALSDQELKVLSSSASKIGTWAVKNSDGDIVGYNTSEANMRKELDKINNFAKIDYIIKGGDPMDVNAQMQSDGTIWVKNSDGSLTQIK